jgi:anti-sigma-K factor RskA
LTEQRQQLQQQLEQTRQQLTELLLSESADDEPQLAQTLAAYERQVQAVDALLQEQAPAERKSFLQQEQSFCDAALGRAKHAREQLKEELRTLQQGKKARKHY